MFCAVLKHLTSSLSIRVDQPTKGIFLSLSPLLFFLTPPFDCLPFPLLIMIENQTLTLFERDLRVTCIDLTVQVSSDAKIDDDLGFD